MTAPKNIAAGAPTAKAAPVGGAAGVKTRRCWGCRLSVSSVLAGIAVLAGAPMSLAQQVLPTSGLEITHHDTIANPPLWRVRYVAPALAQGDLSYLDVAGDMELLCTQDALGRVLKSGARPAQIVITLMAAPVEFGVMTPGVTQYFESFSVESGLCIWEAF